MPLGSCAPNRFMTMTRSKATTQVLTVFSSVQRGGGAAGAAAVAADARKSTRTPAMKGLRIRFIAASLEEPLLVCGCGRRAMGGGTVDSVRAIRRGWRGQPADARQYRAEL